MGEHRPLRSHPQLRELVLPGQGAFHRPARLAQATAMRRPAPRQHRRDPAAAQRPAMPSES
jgi:hypothetical protein